MSQVFSNKESIGKLTKTGNTTVQLSASTITIGAKQYTTGNLVCDITVSGVGGLDTGTIGNGPYKVFAINNGGSAALVLSASDSPVGFNYSKLVGYIRVINNKIIEANDTGVFEVHPTSIITLDNQVLAHAPVTKIDFSGATVITDIEGNWDSTNQKYIVPEDGLYDVVGYCDTIFDTNTRYISFIIFINGVQEPDQRFQRSSGGGADQTVSGVTYTDTWQFSKGDEIEFYAQADGNSTTTTTDRASFTVCRKRY